MQDRSKNSGKRGFARTRLPPLQRQSDYQNLMVGRDSRPSSTGTLEICLWVTCWVGDGRAWRGRVMSSGSVAVHPQGCRLEGWYGEPANRGFPDHQVRTG